MVLDGGAMGKAAAVGAAFLWSITVTVFTFAARRLGAQVVNALRLVLAALLLVILHWLVTGTPWPGGLGLTRTLWLLLSGAIGFAVADGLGLASFVAIGPHRGMLIQTLAPVLSAVLAWVFLGQALSVGKVATMVVTLAGVALVVVDPGERPSDGLRLRGLALALGATLGQSLGQFTAFQGMVGGVGAFPALTVRIAAGALGSMAYLALRGQLRFGGAWRGAALAQLLVGTGLGPLAGGFLALFALTHAPLGLASTLLSIVPIFLLPLARIFFHEPITARALAGTALAVGGAAGLFLLP